MRRQLKKMAEKNKGIKRYFELEAIYGDLIMD